MSKLARPAHIGDVFDFWTVIGSVTYPRGPKRALVPCRCACGIEQLVERSDLTGGRAIGCQSCANKKHGLSNWRSYPEYSVWVAMKQRCYNPKHPRYHLYGGRGIVVCDEWRDSFETFFHDMGRRPGKGYSIERKENDGPYAPWNCVWSTQKEQLRNTRRNRFLTVDGIRLPVSAWAERLNISESKIRGRLNRGWDDQSAVMGKVHV